MLSYDGMFSNCLAVGVPSTSLIKMSFKDGNISLNETMPQPWLIK
jgi:hypothetical protein